MRLEGDSAVLELVRVDLDPVGTPDDGDVLLGIAASVMGYTAEDQVWVPGPGFEGFLSELRALESQRQGRATLLGVPPEGLSLEFHSTDSLGHMAVRGHLGGRDTRGFLLQLRFGFSFEPDHLPGILEDFEKIRR